MRFSRSARPGAAVAALVCLALLVGCAAGDASDPALKSGSVDGTTLTGGRTTYPLTISNCGVDQTFERPPRRVVILNGTSVAEAYSIVMLGLEDTVLANAQSYAVSDDPAVADRVAALRDGGLDLKTHFDIPAEQLIALQPDLVISPWAGGFATEGGFATREELAELGANTLVNPVNCAKGKSEPTAAERRAYTGEGVESSFDFIRLLGNVFDVQDAAARLVQDLSGQVTATQKAVAGADPVNAIIVFPGMSMMNENGLPAVMVGGVSDDILTKAGTRNVFAGSTDDLTRSISAEQLAAAEVELVVIGAFTEGEDLDAEAAALFEEYPDWPASRARNYVKVADSVFLGPLNALAIEKIAHAAHPDRF